MNEIFSTNFALLVLAYSTFFWFVGHQSSFLVAVSRGQATLNPVLRLTMRLTSAMPIYVGLLLYIGYATRWYYPLVLVFLSILVYALVLVKLEIALGLNQSGWAIGFVGIPSIPLLILWMISLVIA